MSGAQLDAILKRNAEAQLSLTAAQRAELDQHIAEDDAEPGEVMTWREAKDLIKRAR